MSGLLTDIKTFLIDNATILSALGGVSGILGFIWMNILRPIIRAIEDEPKNIKVRDVYGACKTYLTPGEELSLDRLREKGYFNG